MLSQEIMAELDSKITYTENNLLLLCDVVAGIKETLAELNKDMPYVFCGQTADYKTKACSCNENNVICLEDYYKGKQGKEGRVCVKI